MTSRSMLMVAAAGLAMSSLMQIAHAQPIQWVNPSSGDWGVAANWNPAVVPSATSDTAELGLSGIYTVSLGGLSPNLNGVIVSNPDAMLQILDGTLLRTRAGGIVNHGLIALDSGPGVGTTFIRVDVTSTLSGAGHIVLAAPSGLPDRARIDGISGSVVLTQAPEHTIRGTGQIRVNLTNEGTIEADVAGEALTLSTFNKRNTGIMQATNGGVLESVSITVDQRESIPGGPTGVMTAGPASLILLQGTTIEGGKIESIGTGEVSVSGTSTWREAVHAEALVGITSGSTLLVRDGLINDGVLVINPLSTAATTLFRADTTLTLDGAGEIMLAAPAATLAAAQVSSISGSTVLTQGPSHAISGSGVIPARLNNQGLIVADLQDRVLNLTTYSKGNSGTMRSQDGGILRITGIDITQSPSGRLIAGDASLVDLAGSTTIVGGTVEAEGSGHVILNGNVVLRDSVHSSAPMSLSSGNSLLLRDGLTNDGLITVNPLGTTATTIVRADNSLTLEGAGEIRLAAPETTLTAAQVSTISGSVVLTQAPTHTISGSGIIAARLDNHGLIIADDPGLTLQLSTYTKDNSGVITAANGGLLRISNINVDQSTTGRLIAGHESQIELASGTAVSGGSLESDGNGFVSVNGSVLFQNAVHASAPVNINAGSTLRLLDGLTSENLVVVNPQGAAGTTIVRADNTQTLDGSGEIRLNAPAGTLTAAQVTSLSGSVVLTVDADHTISGSGIVAARLNNKGLLTADVSDRTLQLSTYAKDNSGTMRAEDGGVLRLSGITVAQTPTGLIHAGPGSRIELAGAVVSGGQLVSVGSGRVDATGTSDLTEVEFDGELRMPGGATVRINNGIVNDGLIRVNSDGAAATTTLRFNQSASLLGGGTVLLNAPLAQLAHSQISGLSGSIVITNGLNHTIMGQGRLDQRIVNAGTMVPGIPGQSTGRLAVGNTWNQEETGLLLVEIGGTEPGAEFGQVAAGGAVVLGGALEVSLVGAYQPTLADRFAVVTGSSITGQFSSVTRPLGPDGRRMVVSYGPQRVELLACYANCDGSSLQPMLNVDDFTCFINEFAAALSLPHVEQLTHYANCDNSTLAPVLNVDDFTCFINAFATGCN